MPKGFKYRRSIGHFPNAVTQFETEMFAELEAFEELTLNKIKLLARNMLERIYERTPVDTEDTRNRWKLSLDVPTVDSDPSSSVVSDGWAILNRVRLGQNIIISNNSVVAEILEYGLFVPPDPGPSKDPRPERKGQILVRGGFSTQAPNGMLAVTVAEVEGFLNE